MTPIEQYAGYIISLLKDKEKEIKQHYYDAILDIAAIATQIPYNGRVFNFKAYPLYQKRIDLVLEQLASSVESTVINGIETAWKLSDAKNATTLNKELKGIPLPPEARRQYYDSHPEDLEAFKNERVAGIKTSKRIWNITQGFKNEIEENVAYGIVTGESADAMARRMQKYLNKSEDIRARIIRNNKAADKAKELGKPGPKRVKLRKAIQEYHPGQGVYRSSYKNALRLTREEINRSYRTADHERWQAQSFVVGINVRLSNNHKHLPGGKPEVCEYLAGNYPKDFKFIGWHIQCLCVQTPIFITAEEKKERRRAILRGEEWNGKSENEVTDVPKQFKDWIKKYNEKFKAMDEAGTLPMILSENRQYFSTH